MPKLLKEDIKFTVSNYTPAGTHVITPEFELLEIEPKKWRLTTQPFQVNVNDPEHSGPGVSNIGKYVSANLLFACPSGFTPLSASHSFTGPMYAALRSNGAPLDPPDFLANATSVGYDRGDHAQYINVAANQDTYMGTMGLKAEVIFGELPASAGDRAAMIAGIIGMNIQGGSGSSQN